MVPVIRMPENRRKRNLLFAAQVTGISLVWVFVVSISVVIIHMLLVSLELKDALGFSVVISLIAIPLFWLLASVLTYVFVGIRRNRTTE